MKSSETHCQEIKSCSIPNRCVDHPDLNLDSFNLFEILKLVVIMIRKCCQVMKAWYDVGFCYNMGEKVNCEVNSSSKVYFVVKQCL